MGPRKIHALTAVIFQRVTRTRPLFTVQRCIAQKMDSVTLDLQNVVNQGAGGAGPPAANAQLTRLLVPTER